MFRVRVKFVVRVRVSKLLGLNFDPNPNCKKKFAPGRDVK